MILCQLQRLFYMTRSIRSSLPVAVFYFLSYSDRSARQIFSYGDTNHGPPDYDTMPAPERSIVPFIIIHPFHSMSVMNISFDGMSLSLVRTSYMRLYIDGMSLSLVRTSYMRLHIDGMSLSLVRTSLMRLYIDGMSLSLVRTLYMRLYIDGMSLSLVRTSYMRLYINGMSLSLVRTSYVSIYWWNVIKSGTNIIYASIYSESRFSVMVWSFRIPRAKQWWPKSQATVRTHAYMRRIENALFTRASPLSTRHGRVYAR
jgi:hypothetical protein